MDKIWLNSTIKGGLPKMSRWACAFILALASMQSAESADDDGRPLKIAFILSGPVSDYGYNYSHKQACLYLNSNLKNVETAIVENVPESAGAERVMEKLVAQGNSLLFSTSYGYLESAENVAKRHPAITFMQPWRKSIVPNIGGYAVFMYEPLYVTGVVAGKMTRTNNIGIVCAHPIPTTIQNINAIALGARSVNPKVKVHVIWTSSWSDPPTEAEATKGLVDSGCDVIGSELSNPLTVAKTAEQMHVMNISNQTDLRELTPNGWLTGSKWNWGELFADIIKSVQTKSWRPDFRFYSLKDGTIELSSFGKIVPLALQNQANALKQDFKQGKKQVYVGPLKDREGKQRLASGEVPTVTALAKMDWFVEGVEGTLPKRK